MELSAYEAEATVQRHHWWFTGRRWLFSRVIRRLNPPRDLPVVDIGCSTGTNLHLLKGLGFTSIEALDSSPAAVEFCARQGLPPVTLGDARVAPFEDAIFSLALATDVVEHVDEDDLVIKETLRILRPGGLAIFTVPAFMSLWGGQDELAHHKHRYRKSEFVRKVEACGFETLNSYYFNYILFGPIWLSRKILAKTRYSNRNENEINTPLINSILTGLFRLDLASAQYLRPPFGVSIMVIARRPN